MDDLKQWLTRFWRINWLIISILIIVVLYMWLSGIIGSFIEIREACTLGDGLSCIGATVYTNDTRMSDGDDGDWINLKIESQFQSEITNITISIPACSAANELSKRSMQPGETAVYGLTKCTGLASGQEFTSEVTLTYDIISSSGAYPVVSTGVITSRVQSREKNMSISSIVGRMRTYLRQHVG